MGIDDDNKIISNNVKGELDAISVKLSPFWSSSPVTWFIHVESQFTLARVSSDTSKYHQVIAALPQSAIDSVLDFIETPPESDLYIGLKKKLIERHSLSEERRIEELLSNTQLGDKRPSELYRYMKQLAGVSNTFGDNLITKLWLRRLPSTINIALIPLMNDKKDVSELTDLADKIHDASYTSANVSSIGPTPSTNVMTLKVDRLEKEISELKSMVRSYFNNEDRRSRGQSRSRNSSRSHSRNRTRNLQRKPLCWYHFKFGNKANKCDKPCNFQSNDESNATSSHTKN